MPDDPRIAAVRAEAEPAAAGLPERSPGDTPLPVPLQAASVAGSEPPDADVALDTGSLAALAQHAHAARGAYARNTERAMRTDTAAFTGWCTAAGHAALPARARDGRRLRRRHGGGPRRSRCGATCPASPPCTAPPACPTLAPTTSSTWR